MRRLLAMLFTLNNLVNVKTAWKNDYSAYKRYVPLCIGRDLSSVLLSSLC